MRDKLIQYIAMEEGYLEQKMYWFMSVSLKALVEYSKDSNEGNKNSWNRTKEENNNIFSLLKM